MSSKPKESSAVAGSVLKGKDPIVTTTVSSKPVKSSPVAVRTKKFRKTCSRPQANKISARLHSKRSSKKSVTEEDDTDAEMDDTERHVAEEYAPCKTLQDTMKELQIQSSPVAVRTKKSRKTSSRPKARKRSARVQSKRSAKKSVTDESAPTEEGDTDKSVAAPCLKELGRLVLEEVHNVELQKVADKTRSVESKASSPKPVCTERVSHGSLSSKFFLKSPLLKLRHLAKRPLTNMLHQAHHCRLETLIN